MAGRDVARDAFDAYLGAVSQRLVGPRRARAAILDELRDGLHEAAAATRHRCPDAESAARAAVREFGPAPLVAAAFAGELACSQARRTVIGLLATGPLIGTLWLAANTSTAASVLGTGPGPVVSPAPLIAIAVLAGVVVLAATGRCGALLGRGQVLAVDGAALVVASAATADLVVLTALCTGAAGPLVEASPAALLPVCASLTRIGGCGLLAARVLACRRALDAGSGER